MNLNTFIEIAQTRLNNTFKTYLNNHDSSNDPLKEAIGYSVFNGGKRIRPLLVYLTGHTLGADWEDLDGAACAIELIHIYSLVHDDLPAMDNADFRRGKPSCHKTFGEALAILAGDALQPLAFEILAAHPGHLTPAQRLAMTLCLSHASGMNGMVKGQMLDLKGCDSLENLSEMYRLKTGALLAASVELGAIAANTPYTSLKQFAECIGLAFQIQDDLLDIEGDFTVLGKPQGIDVVNKKITYPSLTSLESSRDKVNRLFETALKSLNLGSQGELLTEFIYSMRQRKN